MSNEEVLKEINNLKGLVDEVVDNQEEELFCLNFLIAEILDSCEKLRDFIS